MKNEPVRIATEVTTATGTISVGVLTFLQILPMVLGCIATLLGIALSLILIRNGLNREKREQEKDQREKELKEAILKDIEYRRENNLPVKKYDN